MNGSRMTRAPATGGGKSFTGTAGRMTRWCAAPTGPTAPAAAAGWCMSRTVSSAGNFRPTTIRSSTAISPTTSRAAAHVGSVIPGTNTAPCGSSTPTCVARCLTSGRPPESASAIRSRPGKASWKILRPAKAIPPSVAWEAFAALHGTWQPN